MYIADLIVLVFVLRQSFEQTQWINWLVKAQKMTKNTVFD
jgi:cell division inhibitor SulA